ncbi:hypothetical protein RHECNPAF_219007 [Rhizobium etli CNPAF512]|nr:hypothetical protein RHECNPAF_219007 [Rhizobium etli CNPAF512]
MALLVPEAPPGRIPRNVFDKIDKDGSMAAMGFRQLERCLRFHFLPGKDRIVLAYICDLADVASDLGPRSIKFDDQRAGRYGARGVADIFVHSSASSLGSAAGAKSRSSRFPFSGIRSAQSRFNSGSISAPPAVPAALPLGSRLFIEFFRHLEMVFQSRPRACRPRLEFRIIAFVAVALEEIDRVFVGGFLIRVILLVEVVTLEAVQLVEHALLVRGHCVRNGGFDLAARYQRLQFLGGFLVVGQHLLREGFGRVIAALDRELAGGNFEHIACGRLLDEILRFRRHAYQGIDAGLFSCRLCENGNGERKSE